MTTYIDQEWKAEEETSMNKWLQTRVKAEKPKTDDPGIVQTDTEEPGFAEIAKRFERQRASPFSKLFFHLPTEILQQIFSYIPRRPDSQPTLHACCLVSRSWYSGAIPSLYESPHFTGKTFEKFVNTVCPSKNAHIRKSPLARMIKRLDMGSLVYNGNKMLTARLLGRVKNDLVEFVAPQATFGVNCLAALSKSTNLRFLDLSLVSESIPLLSLFRTISQLDKLEYFRFPRCALYGAPSSLANTNIQEIGELSLLEAKMRGRKSPTNPFPHFWPWNLKKLQVSGGVGNETLLYFCTLPPSLTHLTLEHCTSITRIFIKLLLQALGKQLIYLKISHPMPKLHLGALSDILEYLTCLRHLKIDVCFLSPRFFLDAKEIKPSHPLELLELGAGNSDTAVGQTDYSDCIYEAVAEGGLGNLKIVRVDQRLGWNSTVEGREDLEDLNDLLEAKMRDTRPDLAEEKVDAGVWVTTE